MGALAAEPFPSQPWLQPAGPCNTGTAGLGPAAPVHSPLGYRVFMSFQEQHFTAAAVAAGFQAAANITLAVHKVGQKPSE